MKGLVRYLLAFVICGFGSASAGIIDVVFDSSQFGAIDSSTGAYTQISSIPLYEAAGIAMGQNSLFVEDIDSNLLSVNPATGTAATVGNSTLNLTIPVFGGDANGLFALDTASNLYSVSSATGQATLIGATGLPGNNFGFDTSLSSDGTWLYYTAGPSGGVDELYRIDPATGIAVDIGSTGVRSVAGSAFVNGQLALFQYNQGTNYIYYAPDGSAQFTQGPVLGAQIIDGGAVVPINAAGAENAAPEPGTLVLALSGAVMLMLGWRKRRRL